MNGIGGLVYGTFDLPAVSLAGGDYYVVCANAATVANCDLDVDPNTDRIQNGSPDGIRLLLAGATVDAVSYEGDTVRLDRGRRHDRGRFEHRGRHRPLPVRGRCRHRQQQRRLLGQGDHAWSDQRLWAAAARPGRQLRRAGNADPRRPGQRPGDAARQHVGGDRGCRRRRPPGSRPVRRLLPPGGSSRRRHRPADLGGDLRLQRRGRRQRQRGRDRARSRHRRRELRPDAAVVGQRSREVRDGLGRTDAGRSAGRERGRPRALRRHVGQLHPDADRDGGLQPRPVRRGQSLGRRPPLQLDRGRAPGGSRPGRGGAERAEPDHPRRRQQHPEQRPDPLSAGWPVGDEHASRRGHAERPRRRDGLPFRQLPDPAGAAP